MPQIFVVIPGLGFRCRNVNEYDTVYSIYDSQISKLNPYILNNGKVASLDSLLEDGEIYHVVPRLLGGKGGFGSMLRALGAQIEKTTNREACRDISGRRMRDVNNEQKLREWVAKASDREREREQKRKDRLERRKSEPKHNFDDPEYAKQKTQVADGLEQALQQGLQKASGSATTGSATQASTSRKRKSEEPGPSGSKKAALEWMGLEYNSDLDLDSGSDEDDADLQNPFTCPVPGPSRLGVPDSGAASGVSSITSDHDSHSDSGVESVVGHKQKAESPMDIDSDSSAKDSAMNSDTDTIARLEEQSEHMQLDSPAKVSKVVGDGSHTQHGLLTALAVHQPKSEQSQKPIDPAEVDLMTYQNVTELEALGLDVLKAVLVLRGLKCGGTLQERATRLWAVRGLTPEQIEPSLLAKSSKGKGKKR